MQNTISHAFILLSLSPHSFVVPQVFGGLLMAKPDEGGQDETDSPAPPEGDKPKDGGKAEEEVREQVVEILSCQGRLSGLQKQVRINLICTCVYLHVVTTFTLLSSSV
jgi:hypothetical protein